MDRSSILNVISLLKGRDLTAAEYKLYASVEYDRLIAEALEVAVLNKEKSVDVPVKYLLYNDINNVLKKTLYNSEEEANKHTGKNKFYQVVTLRQLRDIAPGSFFEILKEIEKE